jgi:hypothetical protein
MEKRKKRCPVITAVKSTSLGSSATTDPERRAERVHYRPRSSLARCSSESASSI